MKILCVGRNYVDHIKELNHTLVDDFVFFMKPETALLLRNRPFYLPDWTQNVHYETELVLKICKNGKHVSERFAHTYYQEIGIGIDFTERDLQNELRAKGLPWEKAKAFDFSAPLGKKFISKQQLNLEQGIDFSLKVNGVVRQQGNSADMIHSFDKIIAQVSRFVTLKMGDLIFTGTPAGVGVVKIGDRLEAFIENDLLLAFDVK